MGTIIRVGGGSPAVPSVVTDTCSITITNKYPGRFLCVYWATVDSNVVKINNKSLYTGSNINSDTIEVLCGSRFSIHFISSFPKIVKTGDVIYEGYDFPNYMGSRIHNFIAPSTPGATATIDLFDDE